MRAEYPAPYPLTPGAKPVDTDIKKDPIPPSEIGSFHITPASAQ